MNDTINAIDMIAALSIEGAHRFGDDPCKIAHFIECEIAKRSDAEQTRIQQELALFTEMGAGSGRYN